MALVGVACGGTEENSGLKADAALAGLYTQVSTVTLVNEYPGIPSFETRTRSYGYGAISVDGGRAYVQETACKIVSDGGPVVVVIPDELVRSVQVPKTELQLEEHDGKMAYTLPERPVVLGAHLGDAANEALPTSATDPRVFDQDGDGKPGVTVKIQGTKTAEIYMVRRVRYSYTLEEVAPGMLKGSMKDRSEQVVIGASSPLLAVNPKSTVSDDPTKTFIEYRRVEGTITQPDCDKLAVEP